MKNFIKLSVLCLSGIVSVNAQSRDTYLDQAAQPGAKFSDITQAFEKSLMTKKASKSARSAAVLKSDKRAWKQYQRWKYLHKNYLNEDGTIPKLSQQLYEIGVLDQEGKFAKKAARNTAADANDIYNANAWTNVGAQSLPDLNGMASGPQMGRVSNFFRLNNATNANGHVLFAATPNGGLFKSTDNGATWVAKLDNASSMGTTDMRGADDLTAANYIGRPIYVSTGDFDGGDTSSIGVLKSTDGGETYQSTGLSYTVSQEQRMSNLIVINDNTVIVADNNGIKRTTNGGTSWTTVQAKQTGDGSIGRFVRSGNNIMATTKLGGIYYSTNLGVSWTKVRANDNVTVDRRRALAVNNDGTFYSLHCIVTNPETEQETSTGYLSKFNSTTNSFASVGASIDKLSSQGGYDLCLLVDGDLVMANGVDGFYSNDLGKSWFKSLPWDWDGTAGGSYVHADHHALGKISAGNYWDANDGGVSFIECTTANHKKPVVTYKTEGMLNAMIYTVAINPRANSNDYVIGNQDNDAFSNVNGTWYTVSTGDGIETAVNYLNPNIRYATSYDTDILRSTTGFNGQANGNSDISLSKENGEGLFRFPFEIHSVTPTTLYAATKDVYKLKDDTTRSDIDSNNDDDTDDAGENSITKTAMNAGFNGSDYIEGLSTHGNTIVANTQNVIRKSTNTNAARSTWTTITPPTNASNLIQLDFNQNNTNTIYAINSDAVAGEKVYKTTNNGTAWSNISDNLPNIALNKIVLYQNQNTEILFLATDVGVYYKTAASTNWFRLGSALPNVKITDIEINYNSNQLIASSYGRGLWRINLNRAAVLETTVDQEQKVNFAVAPIPANDHLQVQINSDQTYQYQIYNAVGGIMQEANLANDHKIDTSLLPNAYYVLRIYNEKESYSKNIIIKH